MHKLVSSSRDSDDSSIGFHRSNEARERKLTINKSTKGSSHFRIFLKDVFVLAEDQDNCTYGVGYELTSQINSDNHVLSHPVQQANDAANLLLAGRVIIEDLSWYDPHYTPNISNQKLMLGHIVSKAPTELSSSKRSSYIKDVTTENNCTFEPGVGDGVDIPIYVKVGFKQRDPFDQHLNKDTFYRPSVENAQCIIGREKLPDAGKKFKYAIDNCSEAYGEIVSCFRWLAKDKIFTTFYHTNRFCNF